MVSLREYVNALSVVEQYEKQVMSENEYTCKCKNCNMLFGFELKDIKRTVNNGGTELCYGNCPYCREEVLLTKY